MKLAEALLERKSLKEQIGELKQRVLKDARVQEGDQPAGLNTLETDRLMCNG